MKSWVLDEVETRPILERALDLELSPDEIATLDGLYRPRDIINDHVRNRMPRHLGGVLKE